MNRKQFINTSLLGAIGLSIPFNSFGNTSTTDPKLSDFEKRLTPVGRALEFEDYYVWCNSPIEGPDGKIHVFFSG